MCLLAFRLATEAGVGICECGRCRVVFWFFLMFFSFEIRLKPAWFGTWSFCGQVFATRPDSPFCRCLCTDPDFWCGCFLGATAPQICANDQCSRPKLFGLSGPDCTLSKPSRDVFVRGWAHRLVTQSVGISLRLPTKLYPQSDPVWISAHCVTLSQ